MSQIDTAMILAAGRGERLRPLTDHTPKPLVDVGGKTLLARHIERLLSAGVRRIVINIAHLPEKIRAAVKTIDLQGARLLFSEEEPGALETAGGILQALQLLDAQEFLVVNADIWTDYEFSPLLQQALGKRLAHLVMVAVPEQAKGPDFYLSNEGVLSQLPVDNGSSAGLTFAGISLMSQALFDDCKPGWLALRPLFEKAIDAGRVTGERHCGNWCDVGTLERLESLRSELAAANH